MKRPPLISPSDSELDLGHLSRKQKEDWLDEYDRRNSEDSIYYFSSHIMEHDLVPHAHADLCQLLGDQGKRLILLLMPRGTFKSTISSQDYVIQRLIQNPNLRFLLDSEILQNSQNNLGVIRRVFESHSRVRSVWGDFTSKTWTQDFITVGQRTDITIREPSVTASSLATIQVGPHYDEIIADDLHSEHNSKTKDQVEQVIRHIKLLFSLLEPGGRLIVIGTRWSDFDAYQWIIDELNFTVLTRAAYNPDGSLFFPERLDLPFLKAQRSIQGPYIFNCQYMNDPIPSEEDQHFIKSYFRYYREYPTDLDIYITADPALPGSNRQDYFAIVVAGISRSNDMYILDTFYGHWSPNKAIDMMMMACKKWKEKKIKQGEKEVKVGKVKALAIETNIFQKLFKYNIQLRMKKDNDFYRVVEVKHYTESKTERILALQPRYEQGTVHHHASMRGGELEEELLRFPKGKKKDLADAEASVLEVAGLRKKKKRIRTFTPKHLEDLIQWRLHQKRAARMKPVHPSLGRDF